MFVVKQTLDLFPIGNCTASALIDRTGRIVWACVPRVDGDPFFSALLGGEQEPADARGGEQEPADARGVWDIAVEDATSIDQAYIRNTPVLRTVITNSLGASLEI